MKKKNKKKNTVGGDQSVGLHLPTSIADFVVEFKSELDQIHQRYSLISTF